MAEINLVPKDSSNKVKEFFNNYFTEAISFPANQVDAVVGFFEARGFDTASASGTATVLLQQAKIDDVNVFTLLDTLKGLEDIQISQIVYLLAQGLMSSHMCFGHVHYHLQYHELKDIFL